MGCKRLRRLAAQHREWPNRNDVQSGSTVSLLGPGLPGELAVNEGEHFVRADIVWARELAFQSFGLDQCAPLPQIDHWKLLAPLVVFIFKSDDLRAEDPVAIPGEEHAFVEAVERLDLLPNCANDQIGSLRQLDREARRYYVLQLKLC